MASFRDTRLYDFGAILPLILWYGLGMAQMAPALAAQLGALAYGFAWVTALDAAAKAATLVFLGLQVVLFAIRRLPQTRQQGIVPRLAALVGANLLLLVALLPDAHLGAGLSAFALLLVVVGTLGGIIALRHLGRSFSIFPQARGLVTSGPYRYVRHPLYFFDMIATLGTALQFSPPWAMVIALGSIALQFPRMHYEEEILRATYPDYAAYEARTRRLIPGVY
ncbi:MAG: isoprenylcysteine carboxylmethyltransferase family protein [Alphaproteobacteria bacterium]|nr:isoprenylcysteine carboxylmethyltransferase family protein [Alphaproteobacteria bacterium]MBU6472351.1 isoprenylcysteine carboxylmethyltransferase family protein [Alphaproteobacteria bacterium]MDE2012102.1 isoprenylcysteine carboxylmethyltransferase family protein [Alphaproteobacteria bacterium]MDE2072320.1 isoprenylcysteine carboxylmethyltransferase family protein [Alphaproteobacteria bacterium]MDE2350585.1 isoprenylcysteine carboxylmethyltransferase family protein [Alphaproteobacteria bact